MPRVVVSGYYGCQNSGDEAMLAALMFDLEQRLGPLRFAVLSANPQLTEQEHDVEAVGRLDLTAIVYHLRRADLFITGGGSLLQDVTSSRNLCYQLALLSAATRLAKKVMLYGQGIGPISSRSGWFLISRLLSRVDAVTVRDSGSLALLQSRGVRTEQLHLAADVALLHPHRPDLHRGRELLQQQGVSGERPVVGLFPRHWSAGGIAEALAQAADLIQVGLEADVALLPMQWPVDGTACRKIASFMRRPAVIFDDQLSVEELLDVTACLDLVVGMRLHALVFATKVGVPMVGIAYDPKVSDFMQELGLKAVPVDRGVKLDELLLAIEKAWQERDSIRNRVISGQSMLMNRARISGEIAERLLQTG